MGRRQRFTKPIRVWTLGACCFATIFLALSCEYDYWAMKTMKRASDKWEETTYFGLWRTCKDLRPGETNVTTNRPMTTECHKFGDSGHIGIKGTPNFIKLTRAFLVLMTVVMGFTSIFTAIVMFSSDRALLYWNSPFSLTGSIVGVIVLAIFLGKMCNSDFYKEFDMAWAFYYFLLGWFFNLSAFVTALIDRPSY